MTERVPYGVWPIRLRQLQREREGRPFTARHVAKRFDIELERAREALVHLRRRGHLVVIAKLATSKTNIRAHGYAVVLGPGDAP